MKSTRPTSRKWLAIPALALALCSATTSQDKGFRILVSENDKVTILTCERGCAWKELTFTVPRQDNIVTIDQFGQNNHVGYADGLDGVPLPAFRFTMAKEDGKYVLQGLEGTAWTKLGFSLKPYAAPQVLDATGIGNVNM